MKRIIIFIQFLFLMTVAVHALEVNRAELQSAGSSDTIVFINYTGPHAKIDSIAGIKGIGTELGKTISGKLTEKTSAGNARYSVIHAVDPSEKNRLDADIILIGKDASVDHIDNLRRIIAAYLSSAYGYSEKDAETISVFITVYNAVYREKLSDFKERYKNAVTENLSAENCGLSVNYKDWPGKSQIVIPLFDVENGGLSTIDTSVISDSKVVKHMQEDDGKNIDSRKDMVDLKEREAEQATEKARDSQKNAVQEQKKLNEEKAKTAEAKTQAEEAKKEAEEARQKADENPENRELQKEAEVKEAEAEKKQEALAEQQKSEETQREVTQEAQNNAQVQQAVADKKNAEAQSERREIASDQQEVIRQEIANSTAPSTFAIQLVDDTSLLSALVKVNTQTGEVIKSSPVKVIRNRTMYKAGDSFIAIAGENSGNGAVKLVLLSSDTMEIIKESSETASETSVLIQDGNEFYCVIADGDDFVIAKYDQDLNLKLKSEIKVKAASPITISGQHVIVSGSNGTIKMLDKATLK